MRDGLAASHGKRHDNRAAAIVKIYRVQQNNKFFVSMCGFPLYPHTDILGMLISVLVKFVRLGHV
jgi:hypothetical protein